MSNIINKKCIYKAPLEQYNFKFSHWYENLQNLTYEGPVSLFNILLILLCVLFWTHTQIIHAIGKNDEVLNLYLYGYPHKYSSGRLIYLSTMEET